MADDFLVTQGSGTTIRAVEKSSKKTQVVALDLGGAGAESLLTTTLPVSLASVPSHAVTNAGTFAVQPGAALTGPGNPTIDSYTQVAISAVTGANQSLIAAPGANKQIWVYGLAISNTTAGTVAFQDEDDTALTGAFALADKGGIAIPPSGNFAMPLFKVATNKALEADVTTGTINGFLTRAIVSV